MAPLTVGYVRYENTPMLLAEPKQLSSATSNLATRQSGGAVDRRATLFSQRQTLGSELTTLFLDEEMLRDDLRALATAHDWARSAAHAAATETRALSRRARVLLWPIAALGAWVMALAVVHAARFGW